MALRSLPVMGPWVRLHRSESDSLSSILSASERDAVSRRLGRVPGDLAWVPPSMGDQGARFAEPFGPGALYLANALETCLAEVAHHHARHCRDSIGTPPGTRAVFRLAVFDGKAIRFLRYEMGAVILEWDGERSVRIA